MNIFPVPPNELHSWWDMVRDDIIECSQHDKENVWPEDVYSALKSGWAVLYVCTVNGDYQGMMVTTTHTDQWDQSNRWLHVWFLNVHDRPDVILAGNKYLEGVARQLGFDMITFRADREAFERWGKRLGFEVGEIELRRRLD